MRIVCIPSGDWRIPATQGHCQVQNCREPLNHSRVNCAGFSGCPPSRRETAIVLGKRGPRQLPRFPGASFLLIRAPRLPPERKTIHDLAASRILHAFRGEAVFGGA